MSNSSSSPAQSQPLIAFFILAFLISWSIGIPLALAQQGIIPHILPTWSHYLVGFGPMLAAMIVIGVSKGLSELKEFGKRMLIRQVCLKWWIVGLSPLILGALIVWGLNRFSGASIRLADLGEVNFLPFLGWWALPLWVFTFGLGEEAGWRGFALPRLQEGQSALGATLILAGIWALWHLPQFFYIFDFSMFLGWLIGLMAGAVVLTWLYNSAIDSIPVAAIWHGCFNFITASTADTGYLPAVLSMIVILWAVYVIIRTGPKHLISL